VKSNSHNIIRQGGSGTIGGKAALSNDKIWVGDITNVAQEQTVGGEATMTAGGSVTIAASHSGSAHHTRSHSIIGTSDHTSSATDGKMLKADVNGLPVEASNTNTEVASAFSLKHAAVTFGDHVDHLLVLTGQALTVPVVDKNKFYGGPTSDLAAVAEFRTLVAGDVPDHHVAVTVSSPISLSGQALTLKNNAGSPATVTTIDVGALATTSDVVIPTAKAIATYASAAVAATHTQGTDTTLGTMSANVAMGGFKLTGLAAGSANGDSVRFEQLPATAYTTTFANANLTAGVLTVTHNFNNQYVGEVVITDNNSKVVIPDEVTYTNTTTLAVDLSSYGAIAGTWRVVVFNTGTSEAADVVSDVAFASSWDGVTTEAPSKNAVWDLLGTGISVRDSYRGLKALINATHTDHQVDLTIDEIVLQDVNYFPKTIRSVSVTIDLAAAGANGLDTGSEAGSTWYYLWVLAKADNTACGVFSLSSTTPTFPAGYTFKALVGAVRNDSSSNFVPFSQINNKVVRANTWMVSAGVETTYTAIDVTAFVPVTAKVLFGTCFVETSNTSLYNPICRIASDTAGKGVSQVGFYIALTNASNMVGMFSISIIEPLTIYYNVNSGSDVYIGISGWEY
jgi:hypothetical protein